MRIRSDLVGVVYVQTSGGVVCLEAGDTVPDGVDVGEHLTSEAEEPTEQPEPEQPEPEQPEQPEQPEAEEPDKAPEAEETENAGRRRGRRSTTRPTADV